MMRLSRFFPFIAVALLSWWAVSTTHPLPSAARSAAAGRDAPSPAPVRPAAAAPLPARSAATLVDVGSGRRLEVDAVRDNRGEPWLARGGTALWTRTTQGLALLALDGRLLERIPGATDIRETADGTVRAHRINDDWFVLSARGTRRLIGPLAFPSLSADGRYLAYELLGGRIREVHVLDLRSGEEIEVAHGLGRCHCTTPDAYGFPEWTPAGGTLTFGDAGHFETPPEEQEAPTTLAFDPATRRVSRLAGPPAQPSEAHPCGARSTLWSAAGGHYLDYRRTCALARPE